MDVKTLYSIIAVADHGSFNAAARALGLSLSSISVQMRALEDEVGKVLFDRSRRPPPLTDEGREFVERARDLIADWERLSESLKRGSNGGTIRIGAHYAWDGASGPAPDIPSIMRGSLVHDALYQLMRLGELDLSFRETADDLLKTMCRADGMNRMLAWLVHRSVRTFGAEHATPGSEVPDVVICVPPE